MKLRESGWGIVSLIVAVIETVVVLMPPLALIGLPFLDLLDLDPNYGWFLLPIMFLSVYIGGGLALLATLFGCIGLRVDQNSAAAERGLRYAVFAPIISFVLTIVIYIAFLVIGSIVY